MIIDGSSLLYRAFFALPPLSNAHGIPTNAVYGFLTMFIKVYEQLKPDYIAVSFDKGKNTFRTEIFDGYKAHRPPAPDELRSQFELMKEVLATMGIVVIEQEGYEGDDIIGSLAKQVGSEEIEVDIISGDRDTLQLIDDYSTVFLTKKGISEMIHVTKDNMEELYGYSPTEVIEMKALMGDSSDNIPGVPGVGEKTALKLIKEYNTLEALYEQVDSVKGKLKDKLVDNKEMAFLSKILATIKTDMDLPWIPENYIPQLHQNDMVELFEKLGFRSLINRLQQAMGQEELPPIEDFADAVPTEFMENEALKEEFFLNKTVAIQVVTTGTYPYPEVEAVYLFNGEHYGFIHKSFLNKEMLLKQLSLACHLITLDSKGLLEALGEDKPAAFTLVHKKENVKDPAIYGENLFSAFDEAAGKANLDVSRYLFDPALAAYLLEPTRTNYGIAYLCERFEEKLMPKQGKEDIVQTLTALFHIFPKAHQALIENGVLDLYESIEIPLVYTLAVMEKNGIFLDLEALRTMKARFMAEEEELKNAIYEAAGHEFNINSPKQLGVILFEELGLPIIRKTKTGYSTDAEVLDLLRYEHPIVENILAYRSVAKLISTYLEGMEGLVNEKTKRIHTSFNQMVTATGRLSSSEPNLQNIPVRTEKGRQIRSLFLPGEGYDYLVSADYSQIELRVLAHLSGDPGMLKAFADGLDIHRYTAAEVLGKKVEDVTAEERSHAKAVNFGIIYGISDFGLSRDLNITRDAAKAYIETYFGRYEQIKTFMDTTIAKAREEGLVRTMFGRKRELPEITSKNFNRRSFAERMAMNTPIQGSAADIIKIAMNRVEERLEKEKLTSRLLLQVHDELLIEATKEELPKVEAILKDEMEKVVSLKVPLIVDVHSAENWALVK